MFAFFSITFYSCSNDDNQEKIQLNESTFDQFKFELLNDFSVPLSNTKSGNELEQIILSNEKLVKDFVQNEASTIGLKYKMKLNNNSLSFYDFEVVKADDITQMKIGRSIGIFDNVVWDCPDGQSLVERCHSEECVKKTLAGQASNFSSGETITVHHGGLAGVKICSDVER